MGILLSLVLVGGAIYAGIKIGLAGRRSRRVGGSSYPTGSNMAWMDRDQPLAQRGRGGQGRSAGVGLEAVVERAFSQLRTAVQRGAKEDTIVVQPTEATGPSLGIFLGQAAQRIQDAGYIINWADTRNGVGIIKVYVPFPMLEGTQPVP
jgi:hypothetical protein